MSIFRFRRMSSSRSSVFRCREIDTHLSAGRIADARQGQIRIHGEVIKEPSPRLGIMFQNYSLLPWLTVFENVAFAVQQVFPKFSKAELQGAR